MKRSPLPCSLILEGFPVEAAAGINVCFFRLAVQTNVFTHLFQPTDAKTTLRSKTAIMGSTGVEGKASLLGRPEERRAERRTAQRDAGDENHNIGNNHEHQPSLSAAETE